MFKLLKEGDKIFMKVTFVSLNNLQSFSSNIRRFSSFVKRTSSALLRAILYFERRIITSYPCTRLSKDLLYSLSWHHSLVDDIDIGQQVLPVSKADRPNKNTFWRNINLLKYSLKFGFFKV